jgi:hypothetical protein
MVGEKPYYLAYLLRLWATTCDDDVVWRASLESPATGQRTGFASLEELCDYLRRRTAGSSDGGKGVTNTEVDRDQP